MAVASASQERRGYVVSASDARRFMDDYLGGRISDPSDPRASGMQGAYPGIWDRAPYALPRLLYQRVGIFRTIIDRPADDIWSKGWEVMHDDADLAERVRSFDARLALKKALRLATRMARRDGCAIVRLRLRDATGDAEQPPRGVREILKAEPLSRDCIEKVELDQEPDSPTFGEPLFFHLRTQPPTDYSRTTNGYTASDLRSIKTQKVHRDRVLLIVQHPKEGSEWDGDSVLSWLIGDAQGHENVKWAAAEGYLQRNVPPLAFIIDPGLNLDPDNNPQHAAWLDELDEKAGEIVSGLTQKLTMRGVTVQPVMGAERINPPDTYSAMFLKELAGGSRIPQREIIGDAAGALAAASWDTKRYFSDIANDQDDFATPILLQWYARLDEWGFFPGLASSMKGVHWNSHLELSEQERVLVLEGAGRAAQAFRAAKMPLPAELAKVVTLPDDFDLSQIIDISPPSPFGMRPEPEDEPDPPKGKPADPEDEDDDDDGSTAKDAIRSPLDAKRAAERILAHHARALPPRRADLRIEVSPKLRKVEDRLEGALRSAFAAWREQVENAIQAPAGEARARRFFRRRSTDASPEDVQRAVLGLTFETEELEEALREALLDAADLGQMKTWSALGREGKVRAFVKSTRAPVIRQFAETYSRQKAARLTDALRDTVADTIANGGGVTEVREAIRERFGVLENEATIARTESMRGWNAGSLDAMQEAGVREWEFSVFAGACPTCAPLDGQRFPITDTTMMPPSGTHPACRCNVLPVVET